MYRPYIGSLLAIWPYIYGPMALWASSWPYVRPHGPMALLMALPVLMALLMALPVLMVLPGTWHLAVMAMAYLVPGCHGHGPTWTLSWPTWTLSWPTWTLF